MAQQKLQAKNLYQPKGREPQKKVPFAGIWLYNGTPTTLQKNRGRAGLLTEPVPLKLVITPGGYASSSKPFFPFIPLGYARWVTHEKIPGSLIFVSTGGTGPQCTCTAYIQVKGRHRLIVTTESYNAHTRRQEPNSWFFTRVLH